MNEATHGFQVLPGTCRSAGIDVRGMQFDAWEPPQQGRAHRPGTAAQVDHHVAGRHPTLVAWSSRASMNQPAGKPDQKFSPPAWHEDARPDGNLCAGELSPPQDVFQRNTAGTLLHALGQAGPVGGMPDEEHSLLLGKNAPG
jgi:hypothetical protein